MLIRQNMHTHTRLSYCGGRDSTVANTVTEAESVDLELLGISDHIDVLGSGREVLMQQNRDELADIETRVKVLVGSELSLQDPDTLPISRDEIAKLDYVLVSCNHFHLNCVQNPDVRTEPAYADWFLTMAEGAIRLGATIIPHPFSYVGVRQMGDGSPVDFHLLLKSYDRARIRKVFRQAGERRTAFELNPGRMSQFCDFFEEIIPIARDEGVKFAFGSDGHHPGSMHYGGREKLEEYDAMFRRIGVQESDICWDFAPRLD